MIHTHPLHTVANILMYRSHFEGSESEESQESESDNISFLLNLGNEEGMTTNLRKPQTFGINQSDNQEEDKYSITVKAGNQIVEKTVEQVITNAKTIQKINFKGKMNMSESRSSRHDEGIFDYLSLCKLIFTKFRGFRTPL